MDIVARTASFESALNRVERRLASFGRTVSRLGAAVGVAGGAFGFAAIVNHALELGDSLDKAAKKAGVSGRAMSELAYAAKTADVDLKSLSGALRTMQTNLSQAQTGSKNVQQALGALGLTVTDLRGRTADAQFERIADQISKLTDPAERARAATELFGKAGAELLPLFEQGAEGIRKAREEAQRLGLSFSDEQLKKLSEADDSIKRMKSSFEGLATTLTAKVAPALTAFFDGLKNLIAPDKVRALDQQIALIEAQIAREGETTATPELRRQLRELRRQRRLSADPVTHRRGAALTSASEAPGFAAIDAAEKEMERWKKLEEEAARARESSRLRNFGGIVSIDPEQLEATRGDIAETFDFIEQDADRTLASVTESINQSVTHWNAGIDLFRDGMKAAFDDLVDHGHFSFRKLGQFMLAELTRKKLYDAIDAIGDALGRAFSRTGGGKSGAGGFIGTVLSAVFGGGRANGGPLEPGKWYIAGERGPEPIWGGGPGAFAAPGMARPTTVVINNYMDNRGATTDFIQALPTLIRANNEQLKQDIFDQLERRAR